MYESAVVVMVEGWLVHKVTCFPKFLSGGRHMGRSDCLLQSHCPSHCSIRVLLRDTVLAAASA